MPRQPLQYHPFQTIRAVLGEAQGRTRPMTQDQFATLLPDDSNPRAAITIRRIEGGTLQLSPKLAGQITALTGVDTRSILKGKRSKPKTLDGKTFTADTFRRWQDTQLANDEIKRLAGALSTVVAKRLGKSDGTAAVRHTFCQISAALGTAGGEQLPGIEALTTGGTEERVSWETLAETATIIPKAKAKKTAARSRSTKSRHA